MGQEIGPAVRGKGDVARREDRNDVIDLLVRDGKKLKERSKVRLDFVI